MERPKLKTCAERTETSQEPIAQPPLLTFIKVLAMTSEFQGNFILAHTRVLYADGSEGWITSHLTPDQFWLEQELYRGYVGKEMN